MTRRTINPGPTTPERRRGRSKKDHHSHPSHSDISIESPYFSPSRERPPRSKEESYADHSLDRQMLESSDFFLKAYVSRLYRQLALCKPYLIQECISDDPWKVLVAVTLLNKTSGKLGIPAFWTLISKWPTPLELSQANEEEVIALIRHLGTQSVRSRRLICLSRAYLQEPPSLYDLRSSKYTKTCSPSTSFCTAKAYPATPISHLPGTGRYALDSYRIFCTQKHGLNSEWKTVLPTDKELVRYLRWKWAYCESKAWSPTEGVLGDADAQYLAALIHELEPSTP